MMTKSKSNLQFVMKFTMLFPLYAGLSLILGCESISTEHSDEVQFSNVIEVEITDSDVLIVDDEAMTLDEFDRHLSEHTQKPERVDLKVDGNASFGFITDVQKVLREQEALRINYSVKASSEDESLDEVTNRFLKAAEAYMKINPDEVTREELQHKYDIISKFYDAIQNVKNAGHEAPPPPPMVPSPEQRLNSGNNEQEQTAVNAIPPEPIEPHNVLRILMNRQGMMLMNDEPVEMTDVKSRITQFVGNKGWNPNLSDSPDDAIIAIKTAPDTPYDLYIELLDSVMEAYSVLRNEASLKQFGTEYSELAEGSEQHLDIQEAYPERISIVPPDEK